MTKLGLVLGRFQPLHAGHLHLIDLAFKQNDTVVICIGSAQISKPLSIEERHQRMAKQLKILGYPQHTYRIIDLIDPAPMKIWPKYVKETCKITDATYNTFYRGERCLKEETRELRSLGFHLRVIDKVRFFYKAPNGFYYLVKSATEIIKIHKQLRQNF